MIISFILYKEVPTQACFKAYFEADYDKTQA